MNYIFIIGAPKCATSSLFDLLNQSSKIVGSKKKETFFFLDKRHPLISEFNSNNSSNETFKKLNFSKKSNFYLEGTTHTIYQSKSTIKKIKNLGNVKIILVLRNPVDRFISSFQYTKNNLSRIKYNLSIEKYINLSINRNHKLIDKLIKNKVSNYVLKNDLEYGCYANYLENWYEIFDQKDIKIIPFKKLIKNPNDITKEIYNWLGILEFESFILKNKNRTFQVKNHTIHSFIKRIALFFPNTFLNNYLKSIYLKLNSKKIELVIPENINKLYDYYSKHNLKLFSLIGEEYKDWIQ